MTSYGDISQRTAAWVAATMLEHADPILVLSKFGLVKEVPKNTAESVKFRRPVPFTAAITPLVEGVSPTAQKMQYEDIVATLKQYGAPVEITDKVADLIEDAVLQDAATLAGEQAGETIETLTWGLISGGTNVFYAGTGDTSRTDVNDPVTLGRQRLITRFLKAQKARQIALRIGPSDGQGTEPVAASYVALGHTDLESDIRSMTGFVPVEKYGSYKPTCPQEVGKVEDVRYVLTPHMTPWEAAGSGTLNGMKSVGGSKVDVYPIIYVGRGAYGLVALTGERDIEPMVLNPGKPSKSDPLGQRGYVSWKTYFTAVRLNEAWMVRLECGVTSNPTGT
ncbi:MAG: N4-gp56 family major capsid protein [Magnetococcales bacterium]|nr:N4-gp56 family major capsid protein [Magnetococcales bacterium]MBF0321887.1 N4-gp56 family major capsid protein [Magnetococcales bacterium]